MMKVVAAIGACFLVQVILLPSVLAWSATDMAHMANVTSIRLVGGKNQYEGRVEVLINGQWGTVCDDGFDVNDAKVVCRQLGYGDVGVVKGNAHFGRGSTSILLDDMECSGSESSLSGCLHAGTGTHDCGHHEDVGVVCAVPVVDGSLRLVNGANSREGRVEIFHSGEWGTICDDAWGLNDAHVVCRQLGFGPAVAAKSKALFGSGRDPIWLDNVACTGSEARLINCKHIGLGTHNCGHYEDAGVVCGPLTPVNGSWSSWQVSLCSRTCGGGTQRQHRTCTNPAPTNGGRPCQGSHQRNLPCNQQCCSVRGGWSSWVYGACNVSCGGGVQMVRRTCTNPAPKCGGRRCAGGSAFMKSCNGHCCAVHGGWSDWTGGNCSKSCGDGVQLYTRTCSNPKPICGGRTCSGPQVAIRPCNTQCCRVDGGWTSWQFSECSVQCGGGLRSVVRNCTLPAPSCNGSQCVGENHKSEQCNMYCCPEQMKAALLVLGATRYEGLVQLAVNGLRGLVCADGKTWDLTEASIVCRQLFGTSALAPTSSVGSVVWTGAVVKGNVTCTGDEDCLSMCQADEHTGACQLFAAVTCNVPEGSVRLADGPNAYSGRVEVYASDQWGTVCDDGWDATAAGVVCRQLGFSTATQFSAAAKYGTGSGPILLDDVDCRGREGNLLLCDHLNVGEHNCIPEEAAGVTCGCTFQKEKTVSKTKLVSYLSQNKAQCNRWSSKLCTRYFTAYKKTSFPVVVNVTEKRCCKIDGGWGELLTASNCSVSCGGGIQTVTRTCDRPRPFCRGRQCIGPVTITRHCNTQPCPGFGPWGSYSACSVTCGGGTQYRTRSCVTGTCRGSDLYESRSCNTIVNGGWGLWTNGSCSEACGGGVLNRSRLCDNPTPSCGGNQCVGDSNETLACNEAPCIQQRLQTSVYGNWSEFGPCSTTCGGGIQARTRPCISGKCNETKGFAACAMVCCPVDGEWSAFTMEGQCSQTCGNGTAKLKRTCTNPSPSCGGRPCTGTMITMDNCAQPHCPSPEVNQTGKVDENTTVEPHVDMTNDTITNTTEKVDDTSGSGIPIDDMVLDPWGEYDSCTATCNGGRQTRTRSCSGMGCDEVDTTETRLCNTHCCPVNGGWTEYGSDGPCSAACGMGTKSFTRHCTKPPPSCGGKPCDGPMMEARGCNLDPCDIQPNRLLPQEEKDTILSILFGKTGLPLGSVLSEESSP